MHGGGLDVRGAMLPGLPYPVSDAAPTSPGASRRPTPTTPTSSSSSCATPTAARPRAASTGYLYKGKCRAMGSFDAGLLKGAGGEPDREVRSRPPSTGRSPAPRRSAASRTRSPTIAPRAGATALSVLGLTGPRQRGACTRRRRSSRPCRRSSSRSTGTTWTASTSPYFSSGRLPKRAPGVDPRLAALGTGQFDWRGFLSAKQHPQAIDPKGGLILNWNNRPAHGFGTADNEWGTWGSIDRLSLFTGFKARGNKMNDVVGVMNRAATQDARVVLVWPTIAKLLSVGRAGPADEAGGRPAHRVGEQGRQPPGPQRRRKDRRSRRGDSGRRLATLRAGRVLERARRRPDQPAEELAKIDRNAPDINAGATSNYGRGLRLHLEGPAHADGRARSPAIQPALLRRRRRERVPDGDVGGAEGRRRRPVGLAGHDPAPGARTRDRSGSFSSPACSGRRRRSAGPTGRRRSSRRWSSRGTGSRTSARRSGRRQRVPTPPPAPPAARSTPPRVVRDPVGDDRDSTVSAAMLKIRSPSRCPGSARAARTSSWPRPSARTRP